MILNPGATYARGFWLSGWKEAWERLFVVTSPQDVEKSVTTNSPSRESFHVDDQIPSRNNINL